jgi:hypothetical protein
MHVAEAATRIRTGLKRRSGAQWSVTRRYEMEDPPITITVPPRMRDRNERMGLEDRRSLAELLGLRTQKVPPCGIVVPAERYREYVARAEGRVPATKEVA